MNWRKVIQLAAIHVGVSITVVPITSTLNRVMIADMGFSALLVSFFIALPYLLSPLQVVVGNWADGHPLWGRYRSPWIVIGGLLASFGGYFTVHAVYWMQANFAAGLLFGMLVFMVWGLGVNMASVSYLSLVSELSEGQEKWRSIAISTMWTAMILSIIFVSLAVSYLVDPFSKEALIGAFGLVWTIATVLILVGAANVEGAPVGEHSRRQHQADNPLTAYQLLAQNPSARRFFIYLVLVLISIHAQDVLLEPFGAQALQMSVSATSRLTSIWGVGVLLTLLLGIGLIRRWGKKRCANIGALIAAAAFLLIIVAGVGHMPTFFMSSVLLLGLGGGLMTVSNLSFMLDMTVPEAAGLYIGAWGVANFAGQAVGNLASGLLRTVVLNLTHNVMSSYVTVFGLEIAGLLLAVWLFQHISVEQFQRDAELRLQEVLELANL
ncbi:MAG: BCD family MFS transporter [Caldilineaceae bacterium]|nr:BCD family MFS transporter [Caldilineaceae bacterium]MCB0095755.1 BCD family MFS transporter [Caldilineaceae bacterium]